MSLLGGIEQVAKGVGEMGEGAALSSTGLGGAIGGEMSLKGLGDMFSGMEKMSQAGASPEQIGQLLQSLSSIMGGGSQEGQSGIGQSQGGQGSQDIQQLLQQLEQFLQQQQQQQGGIMQNMGL